jgi:multidrug efflux pump subunit AcrA (membrane-fusion protein)
MKKWIGIIIVILLVGLIGFRTVNAIRVKNASKNRPAIEKIIPVSLIKPEKREITEVIHASGNLYANNEVTLYSKVQGKVQSNHVQMGSSVSPGQTVSLVIRDDIGYEFQPFELKSDVKGFISKILLNPGAAVNPSTPIMTLVDIDTVKAVASVDELKIRFIRIGQGAKVLVQAYPGETFFGKVSSISPVCNPVNRTVDVEIRIPNPSHRLKPGMYAEVEFIQDRRTVWTLPVAAVVEKAGQKTVFLPQDGKAMPIPVTTGSVLEDAVEIVSGLKGTESVVGSGASLLENGSRITVVESAHGSL